MTITEEGAMRPQNIIGLLPAVILLVSGCAPTADEAKGGAGTGANGASLDFTEERLDGTAYDGQQLAGKPTVLWSWAPWCPTCPTCRAQAGQVSQIAQQYDNRVNVVGVGGLADRADIENFAGQVEGPTHLIDEEGGTWRHFGVTAQSTQVILDADGAVVVEGYLDDELAAQVAELAG